MLNKLKKVSFRDIFGIIIFLLVLIPSLIKKVYLNLMHKELWLICETEKTARDNGFIFYKFMRERHPEISCYYAIGHGNDDYEKIKKIGNIIKWSSIKHYYYYLSCTKNISSHKEGNPNQTLFTILHLYLNLFNNRIFLQHGVLYQNFEMFHQKNTKFKIFICGAKDEYEFVKEKYGYTNEVKYTGLARFDLLHNKNYDPNIILYMPTWRRYLTSESELKNSLYFKKIISLINNPKLEQMLEKNDKYLYFCPHVGLRKLSENFISNNDRIKIIDISSADIQKLLITGAILITDFSSLHTDFAYMHKPIIYYQYDEDDYKTKHIGKSSGDTYFNFKKNGFGKVVSDENELIKLLDEKINEKYKNEPEYLGRINSFFQLYDDNNCERIYQVILGGEQ